MRKIAFFIWMLSSLAWAQVYQVGPGDKLKVSVIELEEIGSEYRIDFSGNLSLPLLEPLNVQDKTVTEVREAITEALKKGFVNSPSVFVEIVEIEYMPIRVIGAVNNPGKLDGILQNIYLVDAITEAGGVLENAGDTISIMRRAKGINETLKISYSQLMIEAKPHLNIPLFPGDTINIPVAQPLVVSVIGEVNKPGQHEFSRAHQVTILRVIAVSGGFTDYAKRNRVIVRRVNNGKSDEIDVNVRAIQEKGAEDFVIQHNDVVIVR